MFPAPKLPMATAAAAPTKDVKLLRVEPRIYCYSAWQNLTLAVWVGQATGASVRNLGEISREMSPTQIAEAQRQARDWISLH